MRSLRRPLCFCLIVATAILINHPTATRGQTREAKPKATGSISGHVILNGKAAAGIPVAAYGGETLARRIAAARAVTDSDGYYSLSQLAPAQYQVTTLTPNLTAETASGPSYGFAFFGSSKTIILAAGEMVSDIDIKLVRGGVITGRIADANNKPAVEERVALQQVDENGNPARGAAPLPFNNQMYQTDDRGVYRIYGLPAGRYKVSVGSGSGGGIVSFSRRPYYPRTFYPDVSDQAKAAVIELTEGGEATNIDIKVGSSADAYSVFGRVVDSEGGLPVPGARISLVLNPKDQERSGSFYNGLITDSRGEFRVDGLGPGRYGAYVSSESEGGTFYSDPAYFEVIDKDISGVEVKAIRGLSLSGFVVTEGDGQKGALAQLTNLRVSASIMQTSRTQLQSSGSSVVAADGSFQVDGLRPGRISVGVYTSGPSSIRPSIVRIEHGGIGLPQGFEIQPGQSVSGLRVVISYGTGTIRGTLRFEGGTLPADSRTYISCKREGANEGTGAQLDSRGHFLINNLAPGTYEVILQVSTSRNSTYRPGQPQKQTVSVNNDAEAEVTFIVDLRPKEGGP
jgi:protocatechuate 3,4-dioxygenase beta subunit